MARTSAFSIRNMLVAFIAGFLAVLVFHQIASSLINWRIGWNFANKIPPFGVPQIISQSFWGGVWGIVFAWLAPRFPRGVLWWSASIAFGAILLPLVSWYVVPLIKGLPLGPRNAMNSMIINGSWGLGMGLFWKMFNRGA